MILIDGKKAAAELREELKKEVSDLKVKYNKPSKDQKLWLANLTARNYKAVVCYSLEEFIEIFTKYTKTI